MENSTRVPLLINTIMHLKRESQAKFAQKVGMYEPNLSKFISGETDVRASTLLKVLEELGFSLEHYLEDEIEKLMGKKKESKSIGQAVEVLLKETDPITARTFLESLSARVKSTDKKVTQALSVAKEYKSKIKTVRRS